MSTLVAVGCSEGSLSNGWENESRRLEDALKLGLDSTFTQLAHRVYDQTTYRSYPSGRGGPVRPSTYIPTGDSALVVENNSGRVFKSFEGQLAELQLGRPLVLPTAATVDGSRFLVADGSGLHSFDGHGAHISSLRPFLTIRDFAVTRAGGVVVNHVSTEDGGAYVTTLDPKTGAINAEWGTDHRRILPERNAASVATCGDRIFVGLRDQPILFILSLELALLQQIDVPFPNQTELLALMNDEDLLRPAPGVVTAPTFITGLACAPDGRVFALLDLPRFTVVEIAGGTGAVRVLSGGNVVSGRHFSGLELRLDEDSIELLSIAETDEGYLALVDARLSTLGDDL